MTKQLAGRTVNTLWPGLTMRRRCILMDETELIVAAARGRPLREIAEATGTSPSTVQRWLRKPHVRAAIQELQTEELRRKWGRRMEVEDHALSVIDSVLLNGQVSDRLRAASLILMNVERYARLFGLGEVPSLTNDVVIVPGAEF